MITLCHRARPARARRGLGTFSRVLLPLLLVLLGAAGAETAGAQSPASTTSGAPTLSPARAYRAALAEGDATRAAEAVLRMWRGRLTDDRLRDLNRRLRVEADDRTVAAVVLEVSRLQNAQQSQQAEAAAPADTPGDRVVRWLSQAFRPAVPAPGPAQTGSINPTAPAATGGAVAPEAIQPPKPAAPARTQRARREPPGNPALDYEQALLAGDVRRMARAAAKLTGSPVTAETLRKLNEDIGLPPDDKLVDAVVDAGKTDRPD